MIVADDDCDAMAVYVCVCIVILHIIIEHTESRDLSVCARFATVQC